MSCSLGARQPVIRRVSNEPVSLSCSEQTCSAAPPTLRRAMTRTTLGLAVGCAWGCAWDCERSLKAYRFLLDSYTGCRGGMGLQLVPCHRSSQPFFKVNVGRVVKSFLGARDVRQRMFHIANSRRRILHGSPEACDFSQYLKCLVQRYLSCHADVEDLS